MAIAHDIKLPPHYAFAFKHLTIEDGLASNHVSAILQDKKGFIWIASTALQRYDGTNFVTIADFNRLPGSIYYEDIFLCEDNKSRIWIGTPDYIAVYDPVQGKVRQTRILLGKSSPSYNLGCNIIKQDHNGIIWATTQNGLLRYNEQKDAFEKAPGIPESLRIQMNAGLFEDDRGQLWISVQSGNVVLSKDRKTLYSATNNPHHWAFLNIQFSTKKYYQDHRGNVWIASRNNHLYKYSFKTNQLRSYLFLDPDQTPGVNNYVGERTFDFATDINNNIWICTEQAGIWRYDSAQLKFNINILRNNDDDLGLHYDYETNCFLSDRDGHLWIGTDRGINILSLHQQAFHRIDHRTSFATTKSQLPRSEITGLFQSSLGDVYVGFWGQGFSRLNNHLQLLDNYTNIQGDSTRSIPEEHGLVWSFAELPDQRILIGQENGWLSIFNPSTKRFKHFRPSEFQEQTLLKIYPTSDTTVWIGLYKYGLVKWNPKTNAVKAFPELSSALHRNISVMDITAQNDSLLWLATNTSGIVLFNTKREKIVKQVNFWLDRFNVIRNTSNVHKFNDTSLLVGTDHGLFEYNLHTSNYTPVKINDDFFDEWVLNMRACKNRKSVWITTQFGFYRFQLETGKLETFVQNDDIIDNSRKVRRTIACLQDGRLIVGASDHLNVFSPEKLQVAPPPPDVTIVAFKALDKTIMIDSALLLGTPVVLSPKENFINIEFKSLQYHNERVKYYYRLDGINENWVNAEGLLVARYTNLPPGDYTFHVRSVNTGGTFSSHTTSLQIIIQPNFWQTWWFKLLGIVLLGCLIYGYFRIRLSIVKKRERERSSFQHQIAQLEMKALRAQMNPHFIFNALNSIQTFMMKNETEQALAYLSRFARLIRSVLDHSQRNTIVLSREVSMLENYLALEKLRLADQFSYRIEVDTSLDQDFTEIPAMVIQPFVENAIWHGLQHKKNGGWLHISFYKVEQKIRCVIEDNGIGRKAATALKQMNGQVHLSKGLQITSDRLSLYNSRFGMNASFDIEDLYDNQGNASGTRVNLWFPLVED
ncbi:two component regulator with propeller domain [Chitinophaga skermanii]|uniref:Two component regulator with propeller domain n=1 Tax=Chitinophaga skermanii TaxID=331697 RepID=A0A327QI47_9BACT|nr:sensor histidine kinase [Chitinophaga skermanii]RAJ04286.1 two component regulator with propeller domain [Chitinophaga skermanii]